MVLALGALLLPTSLGGSADSHAQTGEKGDEDAPASNDGAAAGAATGGGLARFPRFFNDKKMRVVGKEDIVSSGYAAFIPAARPAYDARMDASLPLARRINAGYRLPNTFRPGEWAPLRCFCTAPEQVEDTNGLLQSTRHTCQPVSWYTVLKAFFGRPDHETKIGDHFGEDPLTTNYWKGVNSLPSPISFVRGWAWAMVTLLPINWLMYPYLPWVPWKPWRISFSVLPSQHVMGSVCHFMHNAALRPSPSWRLPFFRSWSSKVSVRTPTERDQDICSEWPIWSAGVSEYVVDYPDRSVSLIIAGQVTLTAHTKGAKPLTLKAGDLLVIPEGNSCTWHVHAPLMMHYNYGF